MAERIPIGSDHAGFHLKQRLVDELRRLGYDPADLGTNSAESTDYPDYAHAVASEVEHGDAARGILLCGTVLGLAYGPTGHPLVRAAVACIDDVAALPRGHNDANVLVLPARFVTEEQGLSILRTWLNTPFEGGRHARRVEKIELEPPAHARP